MLEPVGSVLLQLHRGCRRQAPQAFMHWALEQVQQVIPHDAWFWGCGTGSDDDIVVHAFQFHNIPPESMQTWERYKHLDAIAGAQLAEPNVVHNFTNDRLKETEIYPLLYHPCGIEQYLGIYAYKPACGLYDAISLYRFDPMNPFSESERLAMQSLVPHLIEARHVNYLERLSAAQHGVRPRCLAAADGRGVIHVAGEDFVELMQLEWPHWRGPRLPEAVTRAIGAAHRYIGKNVVVGFTPTSDMFLLRARLPSIFDTLSARELEIARQFADGSSNKEIARALELSPATVRNHLSAIYAKLGIGDKAALATLFSGLEDV